MGLSSRLSNGSPTPSLSSLQPHPSLGVPGLQLRFPPPPPCPQTAGLQSLTEHLLGVRHASEHRADMEEEGEAWSKARAIVWGPPMRDSHT